MRTRNSRVPSLIAVAGRKVSRKVANNQRMHQQGLRTRLLLPLVTTDSLADRPRASAILALKLQGGCQQELETRDS